MILLDLCNLADVPYVCSGVVTPLRNELNVEIDRIWTQAWVGRALGMRTHGSDAQIEHQCLKRGRFAYHNKESSEAESKELEGQHVSLLTVLHVVRTISPRTRSIILLQFPVSYVHEQTMFELICKVTCRAPKSCHTF